MVANDQKTANGEFFARSFSRKAISGTSGSVPISRNFPNRDETGSKKFPKFPNREVSGSCGTPVSSRFSPPQLVGGQNGNGPGRIGRADPTNPVDRDGWRELTADVDAAPGRVFRPVGRRLIVAVQPWPEYGEHGTPAWSVRVVRCFDGAEPTRRYPLAWSVRYGRWVAGTAIDRLRRDLTPDELRELNSHMLDVLEGALC